MKQTQYIVDIDITDTKIEMIDDSQRKEKKPKKVVSILRTQ